jgi:hypothetical protein
MTISLITESVGGRGKGKGFMNVQRHIMDPLHVINALDLNHEHEAFAQWQMAIPGARAGLATTEPLSHQNNTATVILGPPGTILPLPDY